jgi:hypothetical protein
VIEELESAVNVGEPRQAGPLSQAHKLKELLKNITLDFPVTKSAQNDDLLSETYRVISQLEQMTEQELVSPPVKQQLQSLLTRYQQLIEKMTTPAEREGGLHFVDRETLTQLTAMISSQDVLQRFAPLVKAMGEPVFMLFPMLFGNILSQAQVTYRSGAFAADDGDSYHEAHGSEVFHRVQISVPLPRLGKVSIDLAYRKGELLLNILVQSKIAHEVLEKHLPKLRRIFSALGYYKNQIEIVDKNLDFTEHLSLLNNFDEGALSRILKYQAHG